VRTEGRAAPGADSLASGGCSSYRRRPTSSHWGHNQLYEAIGLGPVKQKMRGILEC
jgi:hypothetical protein